MAIIETLKDQSNNVIYPQTHINAVIDGNGTNLTTLLSHKVSTSDVGQYIPPATTSTLGGVIADNVTIKVNSSGVISSVVGLNIQVVQTLPTQAISTTTIYLVPKGGSGQDIYDEYVYISNKWEKIGSSATDLSEYAKKSEIPQTLTDLENDAAVVGLDANSQITGSLSLKRNSESNWSLVSEGVAEGQIAITDDLPTKLSDLTNDTGFITNSYHDDVDMILLATSILNAFNLTDYVIKINNICSSATRAK